MKLLTVLPIILICGCMSAQHMGQLNELTSQIEKLTDEYTENLKKAKAGEISVNEMVALSQDFVKESTKIRDEISAIQKDGQYKWYEILGGLIASVLVTTRYRHKIPFLTPKSMERPPTA